MYELKEVDWHQLGIQLEVPIHVLTEIDRENPGDERRKLTKVLDYWIKNAKPAASWKMIVKALQRITGHGNVITNIQSYINNPPTISKSTSYDVVPTLSAAEKDVRYVIDGVLSLVDQLVRIPAKFHDRCCTDAHLVELSKYIIERGEWKELSSFLHLSQEKVEYIVAALSKDSSRRKVTAPPEDTSRSGAIMMLRKWRGTFGRNADYG